MLLWIAADEASVPAADQDFIKYTSLHELQNGGATPDEMNITRVAISKVLNSDARWAPAIKNPVDVSGGAGIVYRSIRRDYWGYNKGVSKLLFGGSDDDISFALDGKKDYLGVQISQNEMQRTLGFSKEITQDPSFAKLVWGRVKAGNVEGALGNDTLDPNTTGLQDRLRRGGPARVPRCRVRTYTTRSWPCPGGPISSKTSSAS